MVEIIDADFAPLREPAFETAKEAIEYSIAANNLLTNDQLGRCIGRRVIATDWGHGFLGLYLDNETCLTFSCAQCALTYEVNDRAPSVNFGGNLLPAQARVRLGGSEFDWKRGELIDDLKGRTLHRVHLSKTGVYLYFDVIGILAVHILIFRPSGTPFLFWGLSD